MDLQNLLKNGNGNVNLTISGEELKVFANYLIDQTRIKLEQAVADEQAEKYLSIKSAAKFLDVDQSTLFRWRKVGYLLPVEVGGKRRYKMSDLKKILEGTK